jgi:hypothetical protein
VRLLLAALLAALPAHAQMVKCVDERGVTHYTDKPRPGCRGGEVDIRGQPPIAGKVEPRGGDWKSEEREFQRRRIEGGRREEAQARERAQLERRCASMRAQLARLESARRIAITDARGERRFVEDSEREALASKLRGEIGRQCP